MKLAVIRSECSYGKGGAERFAANLCRELCNMGHEVWVLAEIFDPEIHPGLKHVPIKVNRTSSFTKHLSFNRNAQAALKNLKVDQVIALSRNFPSDAFRVSDPLQCYWMKLRYPGKIRSFIESINPRHRTILKIERAIMNPNNTRIIVTNSQLSKTLIGEYYQYPQDRIHVIYNGVDHEQFTPDPNYQEGSQIKLLFVGQDFKRKGLDPLLRAFAMAREQGHDCSLRVVGSDNPAPYRELAGRLGVIDRVDFEGPTREIQKAYQMSDLFVFPSLYDPFANVVLESLACGLPALTTTTNGSSEIIEEGQNGYVVQGATHHLSKDLADRIIQFLKITPGDRKKMRQAARNTAERYTISRNAEVFVEKLNQ